MIDDTAHYTLKSIADAGAVAFWLAWFVGLMPAAAAILTVVWLCVRIWNEVAEGVERRRKSR